jgi:tetratricopeptide (TPR) repeat protein
MAKTKNANLKGFPQIFRIINAKFTLKPQIRQIFVGLMVMGMLFLIIFNWYASYQQPDYLKELLKNPASFRTLAAVLARNDNPNLDAYLKAELVKLGQNALSQQVEEIREGQIKKLRELRELLELYPEYPDGFAYLSVLAYNLGDCELAQSSIKRALRLDSGRRVFQQLALIIKDCAN